jgi:hypothetical protein
MPKNPEQFNHDPEQKKELDQIQHITEIGKVSDYNEAERNDDKNEIPNTDAFLSSDKKEVSETKHPGRLLTPEETAELEKLGVHVLEDKPEILYCSSAFFMGGDEFIKEIIEKNKPILAVEGVENVDPQDLPSLNQAIQLVLNRKGMIEDLVENDTYIQEKMDRSAIDNLHAKDHLSGSKVDIVRQLKHVLGNEHVVAFPLSHEDEKKYRKITFHGPHDMTEKYMVGSMLEMTSLDWLEPNFRSDREYHQGKYGLDPNEPTKILTDIDLLRNIVNIRSSDQFDNLNTTINEYFNGDIESFQKRWKEYYENWWPKEFQTMKQSIDESKAWLKSLLDPKIK